MSDDKTIKKAIKGDDTAFMELINENKEQIYRTAYAYVKDEAMALDIVQETVCKAYLNIHNLKKSMYFKTWLMKIAINVSTDFYKKRNKVIYLDQEQLLNKADTPIYNEHEKFYLLDMIDKMDDKYKEVIILKYFNDMTISDISEVLNMPLGTIKTYLNKGLTFLRKYMKEEAI